MHLPEWNIYFLFLLSFTNIDRVISQAGFFSRRRQPTEVKIQKKTKEKKKRETQDTNKEDEEEEKKPSATRGESWTQFSLSKMGSSPSLVWRPKPRPPFSFVLFFPLRRCFICLSVSSFSSASFSVFLSIASLLFLSSQFGNNKKKKRNIFGVHFSVVIYFLFSSSFRERHIFELELGSIRSPTGPNSSFTFWMEHLLFLSSIERIKTEPVFQRLAGK